MGWIDIEGVIPDRLAGLNGYEMECIAKIIAILVYDPERKTMNETKLLVKVDKSDDVEQMKSQYTKYCWPLTMVDLYQEKLEGYTTCDLGYAMDLARSTLSECAFVFAKNPSFERFFLNEEGMINGVRYKTRKPIKIHDLEILFPSIPCWNAVGLIHGAVERKDRLGMPMHDPAQENKYFASYTLERDWLAAIKKQGFPFI